MYIRVMYQGKRRRTFLKASELAMAKRLGMPVYICIRKAWIAVPSSDVEPYVG